MARKTTKKARRRPVAGMRGLRGTLQSARSTCSGQQYYVNTTDATHRSGVNKGKLKKGCYFIGGDLAICCNKPKGGSRLAYTDKEIAKMHNRNHANRLKAQPSRCKTKKRTTRKKK